MITVTLNGNDYNDGNTPPNNMGNGGSRKYLFPMLTDLVAHAAAKVALCEAAVTDAAEQADLATTNGAAQVALAAEQADLATTNGAAQVVLATAQATAAANSAATALNAPGTTADSTTSLTIPTSVPAAKSLTVQTGKTIVVGMSVTIAATSSPTNRMSGAVTAYDSGTGALDVSIDTVDGGGTYAAWTVSLGNVPPQPDTDYITTSKDITRRENLVNTTAGAITGTLSSTPAEGDYYGFEDIATNFGSNALTLDGNGHSIKYGTSIDTTLVLDVSGISCAVWFDGTYWRLS